MEITYKILQGFDTERTVRIRADELEKAYGIFLLGGRAIFSGGIVDGKSIQGGGIVPDWCATMGWNEGHRLTEEDYAHINALGLQDRARSEMARKEKDIVKRLNENKEKHLFIS